MASDERIEALLDRWQDLHERGEEVGADELCHEHPELADTVRQHIAALKEMKWLEAYQTLNGTTASPGKEPVPGYRLVEQLGSGGFGQVFKATGPDGSAVALKLVPWSDKSHVEMRALEVTRGVRHPHLLPTLAYWRMDDYLVIALELAEGTLLDRLKEAQKTGLPGIRFKELLPLIRQAAEGIDYLHSKDIQHRDIKPQNMLLVKGTAKVADFGLVRVVEKTTSHTGVMTPAYAAPEFFDGRTSRQSDQYSLAVAWCELRGGRLPFEGSPAQMMAGHLGKKPDLTMLPERERAVVAKALSKKPTDRFPTCGAFVEALGRQQPVSSKLIRQPLVLTALAVPLVALLTYFMYPGQEPTKVVETRTDSTEKKADEPKRAERVSIPPAEAAKKAEREPPQKAATLPSRVFVFDGKSRIVTNLERFAPVTLEAWLRMDQPSPGTQQRYVIGSDIPGKSGISIGMVFPEKDWGRPPFVRAQNLTGPEARWPFLDTTRPLTYGQWHHLAGVFGSDKTVLFLNGKIIFVAAPTPNIGRTPFVIGNAGKDNKDGWFQGELRSVRISRGERYAAEFTPEEALQSDKTTVLLFDADNTEGNRVVDLSGRDNHGLKEGF